MDIRAAIIAIYKEVAMENGKRLPPLTNDLALLDSGLDSLCFAVIVSRLEMKLDLDPFSVSEEAVFPVTFGEFVQLYENASK